ncbi:MAG: PucC family protein [Halieaceae bacterium]|jgi:BCD family chlorophyll transporter-like MFS transporter|nr:PucC family protein [Halieaceae bacterium]
MSQFSQRAIAFFTRVSTRYMPFADVVTPDLPLSRLLRLSLFQVSVGMVLVLLVGTLNRVMIVELSVPTSLVALMLAMPLVFAPLRALIGFRSDNHKSALGWRRVPFIWKGSLAQFGGFAIMPFALLVLAGEGMSASLPAWIGQVSAAAAFLLVGAGAHTVQTAGLALATDLTPPESQPRVVGLMYVMLLMGMIVSALAFGAALAEYSPGRLVRVIQSVALLTIALNVIAVWKQEARRPQRGAAPEAVEDPSFREAWARFCEGEHTILRLAILGLGTIAFGMADVLLEPFGGHVLKLSVSATTQLTAIFAGGGLVGFWLASKTIGNGAEPYVIARRGALIGVPAFICVIIAAPLQVPQLFVLGNFLIGFGGALFAHGTLTASMHLAPVAQVGLALGAWGAVQATAAGLGFAFSGTLRDLATAVSQAATGVASSSSGYIAVYTLEILLLLATVLAIIPLLRHQRDAANAADDTLENASRA